VFRKLSGPDEDRLVAFDPDRSAVEGARRDPRRFEALYRKYVGQVYSFAVYELRDHHAAEDLTEQVFLQALAALPRFHERALGEGTSSFRAWLFQIARHLASNQRRATRRHPSAPLETALEVSAPDDPAAAAVRRDEAVHAWAAVARLPGDRRTAVILRFVDEMSVPEIATVLGRSEGAVRVLLHRALRNVADELRAPGRGRVLEALPAEGGAASDADDHPVPDRPAPDAPDAPDAPGRPDAPARAAQPDADDHPVPDRPVPDVPDVPDAPSRPDAPARAARPDATTGAAAPDADTAP
jgi:RNA polymerase sigma-70 factor (ECF subfamily)